MNKNTLVLNDCNIYPVTSFALIKKWSNVWLAGSTLHCYSDEKEVGKSKHEMKILMIRSDFGPPLQNSLYVYHWWS